MKFLLASLLSLPLAAQTVSLGGIANPPDATTAINAFLATQSSGVSALVVAAIQSGDSSIQLPAAILAACIETYNITTMSSATNTTTATVSTANVPTGTKIAIANATTTAYNATFSTTSAPANSSSLTWALTIADGSYSNSSPSTNGYPALTYTRCAVLVDSEVIGINGTTDGTNYASLTRGDMGTTAAAHNANSRMYLLKDSGMRARWRRLAAADAQTIVVSGGTARINSLTAQITALQVQILAIQAALGL